MIIAINGEIGTGKDEFCKAIQYLIFCTSRGYKPVINNYTVINWNKTTPAERVQLSGIENRKFADALKDITCRMLGCTREQLEDQEFKNSYLPEEWDLPDVKWLHPVAWAEMGSPKEAKPVMLPANTIVGYKLETVKRMTYRQFLQKLGTEAIRNQVHPNAHVNMLMREYKPIPASDYSSTHYRGEAISFPSGEKYPDWVITDCRFPNEAQAVKDKGGIVIKLIRHAEESTGSKHESETALADWSFDAYIHNTGTIEDLLRMAGDFVTHFNLYKYASTNTPITGSVRTFSPQQS